MMTHKIWFYFLALFSTICMSMTHTYAQVPLSGEFIAIKSCPAYQSIKKQTNPDNIFTKIDKTYTIIGQNNLQASHYYLALKDKKRRKRWVDIECGRLISANNQSADNNIGYQPQEKYVLAVSWQSGFCETEPDKIECINQTAERFDATHFSLHGLWPEGRHCGVSRRLIKLDRPKTWHKLPALQLKSETRRALNKIMPGTQSYLHRHEWIAHGTCYHGAAPEQYYADSVRLIEELNATQIDDLFAINIGSNISLSQIRSAFDQAFGAGAGRRVRLDCKYDDTDNRRKLIIELKINLGGTIDNYSLTDLIHSAPPAKSKCENGIVDPPLFQ